MEHTTYAVAVIIVVLLSIGLFRFECSVWCETYSWINARFNWSSDDVDNISPKYVKFFIWRLLDSMAVTTYLNSHTKPNVVTAMSFNKIQDWFYFI